MPAAPVAAHALDSRKTEPEQDIISDAGRTQSRAKRACILSRRVCSLTQKAEIEKCVQ